jgi:hypothetical protein
MSINPHDTWYPWNFAPMMAISLLCGTGIRNPRWTYLAPLTVLALGDVGIGFLTGEWSQLAFAPSQPVIYVCFAGAAYLGTWLRSRPGWLTALPTAFLGETAFFLVSNFGVWLYGEGLYGMGYPQTLSGLVACYVAAIPFFGRSLLSTLAFTVLLYSPAVLRMAGIVPAEHVRAQVAVAP